MLGLIAIDHNLTPPFSLPVSPHCLNFNSNFTGKDVASIKPKLTRITDSSFPIFGEFECVDATREVITFHEKLPVVGVEIPVVEATLPFDVKMECSVISTSEVGVLIDTEKPHGIKDVHIQRLFQLNANRLNECGGYGL